MKKYAYYSLLGYLLFFVVQPHQAAAQQKQYQVFSGAFYNLENLFDTQRDTSIFDEEFTPEGSNHWTEDKYQKKQTNMAKVISRLASQYCPLGPAFIGVAEIENRKVLEDLVKQESIAARSYGIVHYDSPDRRGIDVALLYNPALFKLIDSKTFPYNLESLPNYKTRDVLLVTGEIAGEQIHVLVNHWPSRYGGKSSELREHAASIVKGIVDSLYQVNPETKIVIMGDLNDDPVDNSVRKVLQAKKQEKEVGKEGLFNTMWQYYDKGIGSLGYQGKWNLFDQIIISEPLLGTDRSTLKFWKAEIFNQSFITTQEGRYKGYPFRTFAASVFQNGYSDHFPTLIYMVKALN